MNPIPEEEELEQQDNIQQKRRLTIPSFNLSEAPLSPQLSFGEEHNSEISSDESPSSFRIRLDSNRSTVKLKPAAEYPVLVKGIDIGAARLNIVRDPDNIMRRAFSFTSESGGFLLRQNTVKGRYEDSESELVYDITSEDSQATEREYPEQGIVMYDKANLQKFLKSDHRNVHISEIIQKAVQDKQKNIPKAKVSFWDKMGFQDKQKVNDMFKLCLQELEASENYYQAQLGHQNELNQDLQSLMVQNQKETEDREGLKQKVIQVVQDINDEKQRKIQNQKKYNKQQKHFQLQVQQSMKEQQSTQKNYQQIVQFEKEKIERQNMQIQDLRTQIQKVVKERIEAQEQAARNRTYLQQLEDEQQKLDMLNNKVDFALQMLRKSLDFFSQSADYAQFNVIFIQKEFCDSLNYLKQSSHEALEGYKQFEIQATTDPRELMPYVRASEQHPGGNLYSAGIRNERSVGKNTSP